jgi:Spy/CpxP family protein refolding chaperone
MLSSNTIKTIAACAVFTWTASTIAQHSESGKSSTSPYAGQQTRQIKALSPREATDYIEGKGMGLAKAAELNGYPGPMHVLELQTRMELTAEQREATAKLMAAHKFEVKQLGVELVEAERALDTAFANKTIDISNLNSAAEKIGQLQTRIRIAHLETHLKQTALLQPSQIAHYQRLRGYATLSGQSHLNVNDR